MLRFDKRNIDKGINKNTCGILAILKKNKQKVRTEFKKNVRIFIDNAPINKLLDSIKVLGSTRDASYLPDAKTEKIPQIDMKIANKPNSSGEYILDSNGVISIGII